MTTSIAGATDAAIVERSWGLLSSIPSRKDQFYGPNFTFSEYMKARSWLQGMAIHLGLGLAAVLLATMPPFRALMKRFVYAPGQGPDREEAKKDQVEYRGVGHPDLDGDVGKQSFCRAHFSGSTYECRLHLCYC